MFLFLSWGILFKIVGLLFCLESSVASAWSTTNEIVSRRLMRKCQIEHKENLFSVNDKIYRRAGQK